MRHIQSIQSVLVNMQFTKKVKKKKNDRTLVDIILEEEENSGIKQRINKQCRKGYNSERLQ